jgi:hypothetical protein
MAHTYPAGFIPLGEAFKWALSDAEGHDAVVRLIEEAGSDEERARHIILYDDIARQVERRMRDALADGPLHPHVRTADNGIERLVDREDFRQAAFGVAGIDSVADSIMNPGVETDGRPVLLRTEAFEKWRTPAIDLFRSGGPGKPSAMRLVEKEHRRRLDGGEAAKNVGEEAAHLKIWLDGTYPSAPQTTAKTIENRIRGAHRKHSMSPAPSIP